MVLPVVGEVFVERGCEDIVLAACRTSFATRYLADVAVSKFSADARRSDKQVIHTPPCLSEAALQGGHAVKAMSRIRHRQLPRSVLCDGWRCSQCAARSREA